jgi:hypothetical protein
MNKEEMLLCDACGQATATDEVSDDWGASIICKSCAAEIALDFAD